MKHDTVPLDGFSSYKVIKNYLTLCLKLAYSFIIVTFLHTHPTTHLYVNKLNSSLKQSD